MNSRKKILSAPIQLLSLVWKHNREATGFSWLKLNHSMRQALFLALHSGMIFAPDDFDYMVGEFRLGRWMRDLEHFYEQTVLYRNASAWHAVETFLGRKPFIMPGASIDSRTGDGPCGNGLARLVVGAKFKWNGELVTVTSFDDKAGTFTACSYKRDGDEKICGSCGNVTSWPKMKIDHRYTISHEDLKAARAKKKEAAHAS